MVLKDDRHLSLVDYDATSGEDELDHSGAESDIEHDVASQTNLHKGITRATLMFSSSDDNCDSREDYAPSLKDRSEEENNAGFDFNEKYSKQDASTTNVHIGQRLKRETARIYDCEDEYVSSSSLETGAVEKSTDKKFSMKTYLTKTCSDRKTSKNIQNNKAKSTKRRMYKCEEDHSPLSATDAKEEKEGLACPGEGQLEHSEPESDIIQYAGSGYNLRKGISKPTLKFSSSDDDDDDDDNDDDDEEYLLPLKPGRKEENETEIDVDECSRKSVDSISLIKCQSRQAEKRKNRRVYDYDDSADDYVPSSESDAEEEEEEEDTDAEYSKRSVASTSSKNVQCRQVKKRKTSGYDIEADYMSSSSLEADAEEGSADKKALKKSDLMTYKSIRVSKTSNTKTKIVYDKKQYCLFCEKPYSKITTHWYKGHTREPEVREIISERNKHRKLSFITVLRNKGNHIHNCSVMKEGKGELMVTYRPKTNKVMDDYRPCEYCLGYYSKTELYRHRCKVEPMKKRGRAAMKSFMLLPPPDGVTPEVRIVLKGMVEGEVKYIIQHDTLLQRLASKLFMRYGHEKKHLVSARLREMGRLIIEIQKLKGTEKVTLQDCLKPKMFKTVVSGVRALAGFDTDQMTYRCPSLAIKVGHTLRKCCQIVKGLAIETSDRQLIEDARRFEDLCEIEWSDEVTHRAMKDLYDRKRNSTKRLPLTADTKKLVDFLKGEIKWHTEFLANAETDIVDIWRHLAEVALAYLIIFNRRRQGEVSMIKLVDFSKAKCGSSNSDVESCLSKMERQLCRLFYRVELAGKRGRTVPLLMDTNMFETISLLNRKRLRAGVLEENPYVFATNKSKSLSYIRGSDCLRKFSVNCGATYPETLRSTSLRKHVATMSQLLSLKDNQLDMLAQFMGHDIRTHREYYRLPEDTLQLAKLSKLFLIMEKGNVKDLSGKSLDDVLLKMDPDSELEPDDPEEFDDATDKNEESNETTQDMEQQVVTQQTGSKKQDKQGRDDSDEESVSFGQTRGLRIFEEKLTISVNALSSSTAQLVLAETTKFIADASDKRSLEITIPFTDEQLDRIDFLQVVHLVRITLSNGKIDVEGLKEDIASAMDKIKFILKDS